MAREETLRTTIGTMLLSTSATDLRGMPGVIFDDLNPVHRCFVGQEIVKLSKRPAMEASFQVNRFVLLTTSNRGRHTNVFQVLKHKGRSWWSRVDDPFGEDMIMVFSLPKPFARKLFQVPCSR